MNSKLKFARQTLLAVLIAGPSIAGTIPYPNSGTQNSTVYSFFAASTGDVLAYFDGSGAGYEETLGLQVNGVPTQITGLDDHTTAVGTMLDLGHAYAGDTLTFFINVLDTGNTWYSAPSLNSDGVNHIYSTAFGGNAQIPEGTYVGFEDLGVSVADFNYTDEQFVILNTTADAAPAPDPSTVGLVGVALSGLFFVRFGSWQNRRDRFRPAISSKLVSPTQSPTLEPSSVRPFDLSQPRSTDPRLRLE